MTNSLYVPAASAAVASVIAIWLHVPLSIVHGPAAPMAADIHDAEGVAVRLSDPLPAFCASTP